MFIFIIFVEENNFEQLQIQKVDVAPFDFYCLVLPSLWVLGKS